VKPNGIIRNGLLPALCLVWLAGCAPAATATLSAEDSEALQASLCESISDQDLAEVVRLLSAGVDVDLECGEGFLPGATPLIVSVGGENLEIVQRLIDAGADLEHLTPAGATALATAAYRGQADMVLALLDAGADPSAAGSDAQQPLCAAIGSGEAEVVQILVDAGADPHLMLDRFSGAADVNTLMQAAVAGEPDTIWILVEVGVDVNQVDGLGDHALNWATFFNPDLETVRALVDAGSELSVAGRGARTALDSAVATGNDEVIDFLRDAGALTAAELTGEDD
jgi:ankyrin repeat protein